MTDLRRIATAVLAALLAACNPQSPQQGLTDRELAALAPLKQKYAGLVMGFDVHPRNTLVISLDLQEYIETDDDTIAAMKRDALAKWRTAWSSAHPHAHGLLHVRFIDFIGRKVATESAKV
jgi:hypothetical protein